MKKSLIALTLAALPVAAMADVTLYGTVKAGVEVSRTKHTYTDGENQPIVTTKDRVATEITDFGSRIGFKGHEHLGNNLNAIWQVEQNASVAGTDKGWGTRESFIGLEGGFGKIRAGKLNTVLKDSGDNVNVWESGSENADVLQLGTIGQMEERKVSVRYDSPVFAGFSGSVQYVPRDNADPQDKGKHEQPSLDSYHFGVNYENAGFFGQYAGVYAKNKIVTNDIQNLIEMDKDDYVTGKDYQVHRLTAGYNANNLYVAVTGQHQRFEAHKPDGAEDVADGEFTYDGGKVSQTEVAATAAYRLGNVTPRVSYAHGFKGKIKGEKQNYSGYDQVIVGADYDFSKRTSALVSAGWLQTGKGESKAVTTAGMFGLRHKF